jgi:hypothetical protein
VDVEADGRVTMEVTFMGLYGPVPHCPGTSPSPSTGLTPSHSGRSSTCSEHASTACTTRPGASTDPGLASAIGITARPARPRPTSAPSSRSRA